MTTVTTTTTTTVSADEESQHGLLNSNDRSILSVGRGIRLGEMATSLLRFSSGNLSSPLKHYAAL